MARMTLSDYQAYLAKESARNRVPAPENAVDDEGELHRQIKEYCDQKGWIALHGSMAHKAYRTCGEWDYVIIADGGRVFLCECKSKNGKLSPEQLGLKTWAEKLGHKPFVCYSLEQFITQINQGKE